MNNRFFKQVTAVALVGIAMLYTCTTSAQYAETIEEWVELTPTSGKGINLKIYYNTKDFLLTDSTSKHFTFVFPDTTQDITFSSSNESNMKFNRVMKHVRSNDYFWIRVGSHITGQTHWRKYKYKGL